jgi:hypothetical protein
MKTTTRSLALLVSLAALTMPSLRSATSASSQRAVLPVFRSREDAEKRDRFGCVFLPA